MFLIRQTPIEIGSMLNAQCLMFNEKQNSTRCNRDSNKICIQTWNARSQRNEYNRSHWILNSQRTSKVWRDITDDSSDNANGKNRHNKANVSTVNICEENQKKKTSEKKVEQKKWKKRETNKRKKTNIKLKKERAQMQIEGHSVQVANVLNLNYLSVEWMQTISSKTMSKSA